MDAYKFMVDQIDVLFCISSSSAAGLYVLCSSNWSRSVVATSRYSYSFSPL